MMAGIASRQRCLHGAHKPLWGMLQRLIWFKMPLLLSSVLSFSTNGMM